MFLAIACSIHFSGATAEINIFYSMKSEHELMLKKMEGENDILDAGALCDKYPEGWARPVDKRYEGLRGISSSYYSYKKARTVLDHGRRYNYRGKLLWKVV